MEEKIVLVDGNSILNRAFYGVPTLTDSKGRHTNAVYGFLNILCKLLDEEQPQYLAVAFDVKAPTFRHKMYANYKGTRKPMPNTGSKYHRDGCSSLKSKIAMDKDSAIAQGYTACSRCNP